MRTSNKAPEWVGKKYGRITVVGFEKSTSVNGSWMWKVECDCGNVKVVYPRDVKLGKVKSCGCLHNELARERAAKFKNCIYENKRLYNIYNKVKRRCFEASEQRCKDYGGRGITMCNAWVNSFDVFADWAKTHGYTDDLTLERIDVNGNYCPENCMWITRVQQARNKRDTVIVEYNGRNVKLIELAENAAVTYDTLHDRIFRRGWDVKTAVCTPSMRTKKSFAQKCREAGINPGTASSRIRKFGWKEEDALNTPVKTYSKKTVLRNVSGKNTLTLGASGHIIQVTIGYIY